MSVMACDRRGCGEIMCHHLIDGKYHICTSCLGEFEEDRRTWPNSMPKSDVLKLVIDFLDTSKGTFTKLDERGIDDELGRLIRNIDQGNES
jgi:hypothetical protein